MPMAMDGIPDMTSATKRMDAASLPRRSIRKRDTARPRGMATTAANPTMIRVPMMASFDAASGNALGNRQLGEEGLPRAR